MVLLASLVCLLIGCVGMLPDDYENLCQSIVASNIFSNNILQAITTKNYWDVVNDYKPLMHTWYLGILVEFYLIFPLLMMIVRGGCKCLKCEYSKLIMPTLYLLCAVSFILYLLPNVPFSDKFYYLPFRLFELIAGGIIALKLRKGSECSLFGGRTSDIMFVILLIFLILGWLVPSIVDDGKLAILVIVVVLTSLLLMSRTSEGISNKVLSSTLVVRIGKMSLSIYIWHQVVLAFYRYFISYNVTISIFIVFWIVVLLLSSLTYMMIEQKLKVNRSSIIGSLIAFLLITVPSFYIYTRAGVVRDVPELDVYTNNVHRGMFAEYNDRIRSFDIDFENNDKINVLVIGDSFARDWANILLESDYKDSVNLSYYPLYSSMMKYTSILKDRVKKADVIFYSTTSVNKECPQVLKEQKREEVKIWFVGMKSYGISNGMIYTNRTSKDYFNMTVAVDKNVVNENKMLQKKYGSQFIDIMRYSMVNGDSVKVFTPDHKFVSMDCRHLTQNGCRYYASVMDIGRYLN